MNLTSSLRHLLFPYADSELAAYELCRQLKVPVTRSALQQELKDHPDYPSLLALSDTLKQYGVENMALNVELQQFAEIPIPLITQLTLPNKEGRGIDYFTVVSDFSGDTLTLFHPVDLKEVVMSTEKFSKNYRGVVLVAEAREDAGEKHYAENLKKERLRRAGKLLSVLAIPLLTVLYCVTAFVTMPGLSAAPLLFTLLCLAGTMAGALLLWYETDQHNPTFRQICSAGKKTNCKAILESSAANVMGVSWSAIGFSYFAGNLLLVLVTGLTNPATLFTLAWLNVLTLPYIVFSLYYQSVVAKQYCTMCLAVLAILAGLFSVSLTGGFFSLSGTEAITVTGILVMLIGFAVPMLAVTMLMPALKMAKENKRNKRALSRLKHNPQIFEALLARQKPVKAPPADMGITIGNPLASKTLIKVCNPYCGPCAKAHPAIEELLENDPDLKVQIILMASELPDDSRYAPVSHLMAIHSKGNTEHIKKALNDWYLPEEKDYEVFARKYPMNGELKEQQAKIAAMLTWCDEADIAFTPSFFINNHQLPDIYSVSDLRYFTSV